VRVWGMGATPCVHAVLYILAPREQTSFVVREILAISVRAFTPRTAYILVEFH
jgi:hypothetical protein